ncbi:type I restriction endonuclease subunit R [Salinispira pacifica]|uniref:Type I restriction enzyme endonuclease subunit n=1 Tax=Salinispira pacifica TaxID=1307761 RepID=V5WLP3_9SPIO|nr:HsdR family type I site-specific deoxyribonuclease [Salinispira pacifica]AHC16001.1 Type I restriction-modification system, restriction subunit R [Salinispira pacifica]
MSFNEMNTIENALRDHLVGKPVTAQSGMVAEETAEYIAGNRDLKWKYVHGENLVLYGKQPQDVFVDSWLKDALCRLNKPLAANPDLADEVIHRLRGVLLEAGYSGLIRANEIFQDWLLGRISMPLGKDGEHITIHLLDFDIPQNNHFVVSQQVQFTGTRDCYFDLVLYVNGLPLVVGEVKTPVRDAISWQDGAADFLGGQKHYWENQKAFFVPNLLCFASEGKTFYYGAIGARFKNWAPWHSTEDREEIPQDMRTVLKSAERLLHPKTLLEILQSFVVFSTVKQGEGKPSFKIKILPRYPQYEAAKAIVERVKTQDARQGLIWHFQGSGKSLLMLFAAQMLKADPDLKNPTVVVVVDRVDLDSQINSVFNNAAVKNVTPVKSCKALAKELKQDSRQILITTVFKFDEVEIDEHQTDGLNPRDNIIVLVDEAHRTQEGSLGEKMRWALPNAFFFGLTGTPISGLERNTFKLFGSPNDPGRYLNRYSYKQSIRDEATLPVKFEPRLVELRIDRETIDKEFEELAEQNNLSEEEKTFISQKAGKLAHLLKAPKRITAIADDISDHFKTHVEPKQFKGMVVVYDRDAVVQMYYLLCERLGKDAVEVVMNISQGTIEEETDENGKPKKIAPDWLKWQKLDLPVEKDDFKRWQGIDASPEVQEQLLDRYRDASDPLKVIVVTAKLLTGFDAPICYCMYLDKPLRDHTLLQAMCRTNRLYSDTKKHGLIIDYLGVFENVAKALDYDPKEIEGVVESVEAFKKLFPEAIGKCLEYFPGVDRTVEGYEGLIAAQDCLVGNEKKDAFAAQFNVLKRFWEAITPDPYLNAFRKDYRWLAQVYESIKPVGGLGSLLWESLGPETIKLIHEHTEIDRIRGDIDELIMDAESVFELTEEEKKKKAKKLNLSLMAKVRSKNDPRFEELGQRLERLKDKYEAGVLSSLDWLKELLDAARDMVRLENETHEEVIPDDKQALTEIFLEVKSDTTPQIIANVVGDIDQIVKVTRFDGWQSTHTGQKDIQKVLRQALFKYKLHKEQELFEKAYGYIKEHY